MTEIIKKIGQSLKDIAEEKDVRILYACESGSRSWGFASPDSDYDVRFIYAHPKDWYLTIFDKRDVIEKPITDELDLGGWDIKKALRLLSGSNAALMEWIHSPVVYYSDGKSVTLLQELAKHSFRLQHSCYHYYRMALNLWEKMQKASGIKLKTLFYVVRALLCCEWMINEKTRPPVEMTLIVDKFYSATEFIGAVNKLIELKSGLNESDLIKREDYVGEMTVVETRIKELLAIMPDAFPANTHQPMNEAFDGVFAQIVCD